MLGLSDTICAPATIPGTGALTVIRVSGPRALSVVDRIFEGQRPLSEAAGNTVLHGAIVAPQIAKASVEERFVDDVLVSVFRAPHSYTGEDSAEISCHASSYIATRILALLCQEGARMAEPGEFTRRAFLNGKMDLSQAEAVADIISSSSSASHRAAVQQLKGGYSRELSDIRSALLEITSLLELELDFSEEEVEFADRSRLRSLLEVASGRIRSLSDSFRLGNAIKNGVPVAIVGEPNVGKSTLLNALVGDERAIVSDLAGTTRDSIEETVVLEGIPFRFIDTAGLREAEGLVEAKGIERTQKMLASADIVLTLLDASRPEEQAAAMLASLSRQIDFSCQKWVILVNKIDLNKNVKTLNKIVSSAGGEAITLEISALTGEGLPALRSTLVSLVQDRLDAAATGSSEALLVTNVRHEQALRRCADALENARRGLENALPSDLIAQDLREALHHLGTITGEITTDEVLGEIFGRFCIGK